MSTSPSDPTVEPIDRGVHRPSIGTLMFSRCIACVSSYSAARNEAQRAQGG